MGRKVQLYQLHQHNRHHNPKDAAVAQTGQKYENRRQQSRDAVVEDALDPLKNGTVESEKCGKVHR